MLTALLAIGIVALFFVLMSVRLIFDKEGEFKGTCASKNPLLAKEGITCSGACGGGGDGSCENDHEEESPRDISGMVKSLDI